MIKYNIIFHITTYCNFDCSYCDVIKDNKHISDSTKNNIKLFIKRNESKINSFKFFWWEPLLAFDNIKDIIDSSHLENKYNLVTNTSLLKDEVWEYFKNDFEKLFFSIDSENFFDYTKVKKFIDKFEIEKKVYFNLVIDPKSVIHAYKSFSKLYSFWFRWFNILPVYFTKDWEANDLKELSSIMKKISDLKKSDDSLRLYGFQENIWYETNLFNNVIFVDIDWKIYYWDAVSTFYGQEIKKDMYLWDISSFNISDLDDLDFSKYRSKVDELENKLYSNVKWQRQLHKIMDYFSKYLNSL